MTSMTREEQIAAASYVYGMRGSSIDFTAGAIWADTNPKSPWISVKDDLPCNHKELIENEHNTKKVLVVLEWEDSPIEKLIAIRDMCNVIGSYNVDWYWRNIVHYHVILWAPLPELPKE